MAGQLSFQLSPEVLNWARMSMGYSLEDAADKAGVPPASQAGAASGAGDRGAETRGDF